MPEIVTLEATEATLAALSDLLRATVAAGGSVGFLHPLGEAAARDFWRASLGAAARGERTVWGAVQGGTLLGTVTLVTATPPNGTHRAELAKMMVHPAHRGRGVATALVRAALAGARAQGKTLVVLDTAADGGAGPFYERLGFAFAGEIPDFALTPHGGLSATRLYWKRL